ncbi:MAG: hypothetical protein HC767_15810 [Akkermansiaceae bacterium]|nr:hypothetical protein [Akkermansiaceae bacterium]
MFDLSESNDVHDKGQTGVLDQHLRTGWMVIANSSIMQPSRRMPRLSSLEELHVGDIGHMVDEFSAFARMPSPVMREENLNEIGRINVAKESLDAKQDMEL